ncbi:MAG: hypothetical protein WCR37_00425, partial [Candidatus Methanomethylophilaceae archaeon]
AFFHIDVCFDLTDLHDIISTGDRFINTLPHGIFFFAGPLFSGRKIRYLKISRSPPPLFKVD